MSNADLAAEALTVLWTLVRATALWILATLTLLTLAFLAGIALICKIARLIHDNDPET